MANLTLTAAPRLGGIDITHAGTRIQERDDLAMVSAAIPLGGEATFTKALKSGLKLAEPNATTATTAADTHALRLAADQLMLLFPYAGTDPERHVNTKLKGSAYTTEQTGAWIILELSGAQIWDAMERLCPLDLSDAKFPVGTFARTVMEHMSAVVYRTGPETILLMSASSSAESFLHAIETSVHNVS